MGYWLGVTKNCGDAFTYHIYVPETHQVIARSVIRPFTLLYSHTNVRMGRDVEFHNANQALDEPHEGPLDLDLISLGQTLKVIPTFILPNTNFEPLTISHISLLSTPPISTFDVRDAYTYNLFQDSESTTTDDASTTSTTTNDTSPDDDEPIYGSDVDNDPDLLNYNLIIDNWNRHNDGSN